MGESSFEELLPWLMSTLTTESSSVDRSGAAQGLAEVVGGLGVDNMHKLLPEIGVAAHPEQHHHARRPQPGLDSEAWQVLHVVLANSPITVYNTVMQDKLVKTLLSYLAPHRVPIASNGVRSAGFLLAHCLKYDQAVPG